MKRFTESSKWSDLWFMDLKIEHKLLWIYLLDNCDHAGVYKPNLRLLAFQMGHLITKEDLFKYMEGRVVELKSGNWFIPGFIKFQYGNLTRSNSAHKGVLRVLSREEIDTSEYEVDCEDGASRHRIGKVTRKEILVRDAMTCHYCGQHGNFETLVVDHIVPRAKGGTNDDSNLVCACVKCNSEKSDMDYDEYLALKGPFKGLLAPQDKDKDKDKDKEQDKKASATKPTAFIELPELPEQIRTPRLVEAWSNWTAFRASLGKKKAVTPFGANQSFKDFAAWGEAGAIASIENSIRNGWQGLFEPSAKSVDGQSRFDAAPAPALAQKIRIPDNLRPDYKR